MAKMKRFVMHRTNKSILFAQIFNPYEAIAFLSAQMNDGYYF